MQEEKKIVRSNTDSLSGKSVNLFVQSNLVQLKGDWYWDLYTDAVFCSDVILSTPIDFTGTKGLLHPDDKAAVLQQLATQNRWAELQFRMITTYGELKTLVGYNVQVEEDETENAYLHNALFNPVEFTLPAQGLSVLKEAYHQSEKNTGIGTWFHNKSTHHTWYSAQVYRIYDLPPASLNAHLNTFNSFIHPEDAEAVTDFLDKAYKKQIPLHLEFRIVTPRKVKYILQMMQWSFSPEGEIVWCVTVQDITEQMEAEKAMAEATNMLQFNRQLALMDEQHAAIGHWQINLITRNTAFSNNLYRLFGLKAQSIAASMSTFINFIHPEDRENYEMVFRKMIKEHKEPDLDYRIIRSDGKVRYFSQKAKLLELGDELVMAGLIQDVTVQKNLEKKIALLTEAALLQNNIHQHTTETAGIATWTWDVTTGNMEGSESLFKLLGLKPQQMALTQKQLLTFIHFDDQKKFTDAVTMMTQQRQDIFFTFRMLQRGKIKHFKAAFRFADGLKKDQVIGTFQDVTQVYELEAELLQQKQLAWALAENVLDRVLITDEDNRIVLWNHKCEEFYKLKSSEVIGRNYFEIFPHLKTSEELLLLNRVLQGETIRNLERKTEQRYGFFELHLLPLWREDNTEVGGIIHIIRDLTKEMELRRSHNERLSLIESILESSVDQIIALDKNMNYLVWNKQCELQYGIPKEKVIGKNILEVFPQSRNLPAYDDFRKALRGETVYLPASNIDDNDETTWQTWLIPVRNEKEEIIAVLWTQHDLANEKDLQAHKTKMHHLIDALHEGYLEVDHEFRIMALNHFTELFWGKQSEELIGKSMQEVFPIIKGSEIYNTLKQCAAHQETYRGEFLSPITGNWIHVSIAPTTTGVAILFYDIQKIKEAELAVEQQGYLIQQVNTALPDAITIYDLENSHPIYLNDNLPDWTGYTADQLMNMKVADRLQLIHEDDRERLLQFNQHMLQVPDEQIEVIEYRLKTTKGLIWVRNKSKVYKRNSAGKTTHLLSFIQDFTEEVELRNKLEERSRYANIIFDSAINQMIVLNNSFEILAWNKRSEDVTGVKKETAIGKNFFELFPKLKEDAIIYDAFAKAASGNFVQLPPKKAIYFNGVYERYFLPLKNSQGEANTFLLMLLDVTHMMQQSEELHLLNQTLEKKNRELEQKHEEILHFSFVASHDLKEPLRKMYMFSDWLLENEIPHVSENGQSYLERMKEAVLRMELLIEDVLVLTKIHSDRHIQDETDLEALLQKTRDELSDRIKKSGAKIQADTLPHIKGNGNQLFFLFKNLLSNSLKFRKEDIPPTINIKVEHVLGSEIGKSEDEFLKISFQDNGLGFDPKYAKKIFQIFQRLHSKTHMEGTGIGLAICKKIMDNHNGFIVASSAEGKGATFDCYFPLTSLIHT